MHEQEFHRRIVARRCDAQKKLFVQRREAPLALATSLATARTQERDVDLTIWRLARSRPDKMATGGKLERRKTRDRRAIDLPRARTRSPTLTEFPVFRASRLDNSTEIANCRHVTREIRVRYARIVGNGNTFSYTSPPPLNRKHLPCRGAAARRRTSSSSNFTKPLLLPSPAPGCVS